MASFLGVLFLTALAIVLYAYLARPLLPAETDTIIDGVLSRELPELVVHGTADELIPIAHGKKLAEILPNATGLWLDGVVHGFPPPDLDGLLSRLLAHLEGAGHDHLPG